MTRLEKFRGGIGVRGPGEPQLETDRRLVGQRFRLLKGLSKAADIFIEGRLFATLDPLTREADLLLHVIDAPHPTWEERRLVVDEVLAELGVHDTPVIHVFNKMDRLMSDEELAFQERINVLLPGSVFVSTVRSDGLEPLRARLLEERRKSRPVVEVRLSPSDGKTLAELHRGAEMIGQAVDDSTGELLVQVRAGAELLARLGLSPN